MPLIEILPNSTSVSAPGWAYVPDTGFDPSKAAIQPSGARHRAARKATVPSGQETSARQTNAILKHLAELDRDFHREVHIPIPNRQKDGAGRGSRGKVTPAVRKILASQKTFANHLADEEAMSTAPSQTATLQGGVTGGNQGNRRSSKSILKKGSTSAEGPSTVPAASPSFVFPSPGAANLVTTGQTGLFSFASNDDPDRDNPLLRSYAPPMPPSELIKELVNAPPLSYAAARAGPSVSGVPFRHFCEICGYWGRAKCLKCGARVCGLDCKGVHDEGRCLRFYA
ncbi:MAG: hypothetical protein M1817_002170 [Caeruleum heppii]|nr:MAG: hypothetical protein M1817_002170 [Caeruleum heppii]